MDLTTVLFILSLPFVLLTVYFAKTLRKGNHNYIVTSKVYFSKLPQFFARLLPSQEFQLPQKYLVTMWCR